MVSVGGVDASTGNQPATAVTIGNFDGCHLGHASLISMARSLAGERGRVVAMCFWPHPRTVLTGESAAVLTSIERRERLLRELGADEVVRLEPTRALLSMSPREFVERVIVPIGDGGARHVVEGGDFRFGKGRAGDVGTLEELGREFGFRMHVAPTVEVAMSDHQLAPASSSLVRWLISAGRVEDAARVLGRAYVIDGVVERGDRRGREIGFPTANVRTDGLVPREGIYAGAVHLADGRAMAAALHVGRRLTFDDPRPTVEAFVMGWGGPLGEGGNEYGWSIGVEFRYWLRDQLKFAGVGALVEQMRRDVARAERMMMCGAGSSGGPAAGSERRGAGMECGRE